MITTNKVAIYVRVSTTSQAEEGYSIDEQIAKLKSYCDIKDWTLYKVYRDAGFSGSNIKRPGLQSLIADAKNKHFDTVLVYKLDRLSRSQKDTLYLIEEVFIKQDISFFSLQENFDTSTAFGKAMIGLLAVFAQLEREQIKERMQLGKLGRAKAGKSMMWARTSYGYIYNKETSNVIINPAEAEIVKIIYTEYLAGRSITKLKDYLNEQGLNTKTRPWYYRAIHMILSNPVYAGYNQYMGQLFKGDHQPIISKEDYDRTQEELKRRQIKAAEMNNNPRPFRAKYMLSGLARCGYCGAPLRIEMTAKRKTDGGRTYRYSCMNRTAKRTIGPTVYNNGKKCESGLYYREDLEKYVLNEVAKLQHDPEAIETLIEPSKTTVNEQELKSRLNVLDTKISRLNDLYLNNLTSLEELKEKTAGILREKSILEKQLTESPTLRLKNEKEKINRIQDKADIRSLPYNDQATIVRSLIQKVDVTAEAIKIRWLINNFSN